MAGVPNGRVTVFDIPAAKGTEPFKLNDRGQIVGYTVDDPVTMAGARGFLLAKGAKGPSTPINFPGAPGTLVAGLNDQGQIVGFYENPAAAPNPQRTVGQPLRGMARAPTAR